jgi:hypothetical protein
MSGYGNKQGHNFSVCAVMLAAVKFKGAKDPSFDLSADYKSKIFSLHISQAKPPLLEK